MLVIAKAKVHCQRNIRRFENTIGHTNIGGTSVSYTHLDVYKRQEYITTGKIDGSFKITYQSDSVFLDNGKIVIKQPQVVYEKDTKKAVSGDVKQWDGNLSFMELLLESIISAIKAIIPLCLFLFVVLRFLLREKIPQADEISIGILFAIIGLSIFGIGIYLGLTPIGSQLGGNIPAAFARIRPWGLDGNYGPLFTQYGGKIVVIVFGFFLGYAATLAEPASVSYTHLLMLALSDILMISVTNY